MIGGTVPARNAASRAAATAGPRRWSSSARSASVHAVSSRSKGLAVAVRAATRARTTSVMPRLAYAEPGTAAASSPARRQSQSAIAIRDRIAVRWIS